MFVLFMGLVELKRSNLITTLLKMFVVAILSASVLACSYYLHFRLARDLEGYKDYEVSSQYKEILKAKNTSVRAFIL